ncbi:hypothetical protein [Nonomuraea sp. NPDC050643]|uniref:hypothetical protein n=1 Tax=Nonomuraea sp. NPDC050643 TaxID=3155660 RepID=UPI0033D33C2F
MLTRVKRLAVVSVLALAGASLPASSAQALVSYTCTSGSRVYFGDLLGYVIIASGCTPGGPPGITIPGGTYSCRSYDGTPELGIISGRGC